MTTNTMPSLRNQWALYALAASLALLFGPLYYRFANGYWGSEEFAHGPIVAAIIVWSLWQNRSVFNEEAKPLPILGGLLILVGLFVYVIGEVADLIVLSAAAQVPIFMGTLLFVFGFHALKKLWFSLFFLLFLIPLPGLLVALLTQPLKAGISDVAEGVLYFFGYPIARQGVVLSIGQYRLFVADACSGLQSIVSLTSMGVLYVFLMAHRSIARNAILVASIVPIAIAANIIRVIALVLITYHFGDDAAKGFTHSFAGIVLFVMGLTLLMLLDRLMDLIPAFRNKVSLEGRAK